MVAKKNGHTGYHWSSNDYDSSDQRPASPPTPESLPNTLPPYSGWQTNYSYTYPPHDGGVSFSNPFERKNDPYAIRESASTASRNIGLGVSLKDERHSPLMSHRGSDHHSPLHIRPMGLGLASHRNHTGGGGFDAPGARFYSPEDPSRDEDDEMEDNDMETDGRTTTGSTVAGRTAASRKAKRFRLTHQQTRFLKSEFSKQAHPDAAHRERLSREIPGLSSRQVQVWFQNRRAKMKRLHSEVRDHFLKMTAVPEDFDNVKALHSPYGAVHGLGSALPTPEVIGQPFADVMRPLVPDSRHSDAASLSPTKPMTPFEGHGFTPSNSSPDTLPNLSTPGSDRYPYSSPMPGYLGGSRPGGYFHPGGTRLEPQGLRSLQPSQYRDSVSSRPRTESLQSPLRSGMGWRGEAIEYSNYHLASGSPSLSDRHPSIYSMASTSSSNTVYSGDSYSADHRPRVYNTAQPKAMAGDHVPPTGLGLEIPVLHQDAHQMRSTTASASLPLPNQYQGLDAANSPTGYSPATSTAYSAPVYASAYSSAPLAPGGPHHPAISPQNEGPSHPN